MTDIVSDVLGKQVTIDTPVEELAAAAREKGLEIKPEWTAGKIIAEIYDELARTPSSTPRSCAITPSRSARSPSVLRTTRV